MNLLFICTISLLITHNLFCSDAERLRAQIDTVIAPNNAMTSAKFFLNYFDAETDTYVICQHSKELSEYLYQKALDQDLDAMWQLAEKADDADHCDATIPIYWLSKIAQRTKEIPESLDTAKLRRRAEEKINAITQHTRLLQIKEQEKIESKKRKKQRNRLNALLEELDTKKRRLDTEQTWSIFK